MPTEPNNLPDPAADFDFKNILAKFQKEAATQLQAAKNKLRNDLIPELLGAGVANVEVAYSGYGDSGAVDDIQYRDAAGEAVDRSTVAQTTQLEEALCEFLPYGYENNDGGQGTLTLDVQTGHITLAHQENYTESRDINREFTL